MNATDKMIKARAALIIEQRFFGSLALRLKLVEDSTCETAWTDGISLGFNPEWINTLNMPELKGLICHEVLHCANGHHLRRNGRDFEDWNLGCDYAIDPILIKAGMSLPDGGHIDSSYSDLSAEGIYSAIQGKKKKNQDDQQQQNNQQNASNNANNQVSQPGQGQAKGQQSKQSQNGCGEVRDYPGNMSEAEKAQNQQDWQVAVASAANHSQNCGQMAGNTRELVSQLLDPKVPWQEVLNRFVEQIANNDYSFQRPNTRYGSTQFIMPSLFNRELPPIDIWVDTSGSISTTDKKQFVTEINEIRSHYQTTIRVIYCDTEVRYTEVIEPMDEFTQLDCRGGGGTRFAPAIKWSQENEDQPVCGIYLTDLDCSDYGSEPDFPVLWIDTRSASYVKTPPFGEVVRMNPKRY